MGPHPGNRECARAGLEESAEASSRRRTAHVRRVDGVKHLLVVGRKEHAQRPRAILAQRGARGAEEHFRAVCFLAARWARRAPGKGGGTAELGVFSTAAT